MDKSDLLLTDELVNFVEKRPDYICFPPSQAQGQMEGLMAEKSGGIWNLQFLAKVGRDRIMHDLHTKHPEYGWNTNSGYGSKTHMEAIEQHGVTIHHRRSFSPVRAALAA